MHVPKAYTINGFLLAAAIASWTVFLNWKSTAAAREKAEVKVLSDQFLFTRLPRELASVQLFPGTHGADAIPAFPDLKGKPMGPTESRQLDALIQFHVVLAFARQTGADPAWRRIGEAHVSGPSDPAPAVLTVYETPAGGIGLSMDGTCYSTNDESARKVLQFIHDTQTNTSGN